MGGASGCSCGVDGSLRSPSTPPARHPSPFVVTPHEYPWVFLWVHVDGPGPSRLTKSGQGYQRGADEGSLGGVDGERRGDPSTPPKNTLHPHSHRHRHPSLESAGGTGRGEEEGSRPTPHVPPRDASRTNRIRLCFVLASRWRCR